MNYRNARFVLASVLVATCSICSWQQRLIFAQPRRELSRATEAHLAVLEADPIRESQFRDAICDRLKSSTLLWQVFSAERPQRLPPLDVSLPTQGATLQDGKISHKLALVLCKSRFLGGRRFQFTPALSGDDEKRIYESLDPVDAFRLWGLSDQIHSLNFAAERGLSKSAGSSGTLANSNRMRNSFFFAESSVSAAIFQAAGYLRQIGDENHKRKTFIIDNSENPKERTIANEIGDAEDLGKMVAEIDRRAIIAGIALADAKGFLDQTAQVEWPPSRQARMSTGIEMRPFVDVDVDLDGDQILTRREFEKFATGCAAIGIVPGPKRESTDESRKRFESIIWSIAGREWKDTDATYDAKASTTLTSLSDVDEYASQLRAQEKLHRDRNLNELRANEKQRAIIQNKLNQQNK